MFQLGATTSAKMDKTHTPTLKQKQLIRENKKIKLDGSQHEDEHSKR